MKELVLAILVAIAVFGVAAQQERFLVKKGDPLLAKTNAILIMRTNDPGVAEFISKDDMARELIADGTVCKVHGHIWSTPQPQLVSVPAIYPPPPLDGLPQVRKCGLCGIQQTRKFTEWTDERP